MAAAGIGGQFAAADRAETEADDTAETAEKEATLKKSALKASPSNAEAKDNRGESGTNKAEAESGANKAESGADANTGKAEAGADAGADKAEAGANEAPNGTATGAEIKTEIEAFLELDEAIAVQKFSLGAKESDIILPDTLDVEVEGTDEMLAEDSQNVHLVEAANKGTEKDTEAETAVWQISGITWKLNEEQSDLPEFHGGISEKDYFEEFDENGEPVETSTKTWAGYAEANQEYNGRVYVYTPILPEDLGKFEVADTADLPEIDVMVGDASVALLADAAPYDLNNNYLVIDENNLAQFNGKTITGNYCPSTRPNNSQFIKGGITIDNVKVDLTINDVTIQSGGAGASGWDLAGIYLKGNARLNLTLEGENTLLGLDHGAGIEVEKGATLVITEQSNGSLKVVGGGYGAAGIGGNAGSTDSEGTNYGTGTIIIKGGTISAEGGVYWVSGVTDYQGGAGIGTGTYGIGGTIKILGGTITAEGGKNTGAGIGGGTGGGVDTIVIGGANGEAPDITVSSYNSAWGYLGAAIGSGWNGVSDLKLSCGDIRILSGSVKVKGGNIGYGVLRNGYGNSMKGGSITISEEVQLELPLESKIEPRGDCTYGQKTFRITAYDNQLPDGTYPADISLYRENDRERTTRFIKPMQK